MVINHLLNGMILQVQTSSPIEFHPTIESHGGSMQIQAAIPLCVVDHYCDPCRNDNLPEVGGCLLCQMDGPTKVFFSTIPSNKIKS